MLRSRRDSEVQSRRFRGAQSDLVIRFVFTEAGIEIYESVFYVYAGSVDAEQVAAGMRFHEVRWWERCATEEFIWNGNLDSGR